MVCSGVGVLNRGYVPLHRHALSGVVRLVQDGSSVDGEPIGAGDAMEEEVEEVGAGTDVHPLPEADAIADGGDAQEQPQYMDPYTFEEEQEARDAAAFQASLEQVDDTELPQDVVPPPAKHGLLVDEVGVVGAVGYPWPAAGCHIAFVVMYGTQACHGTAVLAARDGQALGWQLGLTTRMVPYTHPPPPRLR